MQYAKIFVPILIVLAIGYFFFEKSSLQKKPGVFATLGEYYFVEANQIDRLEISGSDGKVVIAKEQGSWQIESPFNSPAENETVNSLVNGILQNPVHRVLPADQVGNLEEYGLDKPENSITMYGGGEPLLDLKLGEKNPTGSDFYAKKGAGGEIITTAVQVMDKLVFDPNHFRAKKPIQIDEESIAAIILKYSDSHWRLDKRGDTGNWYITEPEMFRAKNSKISRLIEQLKSMEIVKFLNKKLIDEEPNGFAVPSVVVEIIGNEQSGGGTIELVLGDTDVPSNAVYARLSLMPEEDVLVEASILHKLQLTLDDLRENSIFLVDPQQIESLDVRERGAKNLSIYQTPQNEWKMLSPSSGTVPESALKNFIESLTTLRPDKYISSEELDTLDNETTGFEAYSAKIEVKRRGYEEFQIIIGRKNEDKLYYVKASDIEGAYLISEEVIGKFFEANKRLKGE